MNLEIIFHTRFSTSCFLVNVVRLFIFLPLLCAAVSLLPDSMFCKSNSTLNVCLFSGRVNTSLIPSRIKYIIFLSVNVKNFITFLYWEISNLDISFHHTVLALSATGGLSILMYINVLYLNITQDWFPPQMQRLSRLGLDPSLELQVYRR